jgi:LacI family transcriptional regulator
MKPRITQTDVARAAGVHNTTVSLALRNSPAIPECTRERIRAIAKQMGYRPDPALQALVAYRNGKMPNRRQETIAYVTNWDSRWGWQDLPAHARCHGGAQRKAAQCGFKLEHVWYGEPGMNQRRLGSVLYHRGITGMILASQRPSAEAWNDIDWSRLSAIKVGCHPHAPALHSVSPDHAGAVRIAMRRILAAGYERVGLVVPGGWDDFVDQAWSAGFLGEAGHLPEENRIPVLRYAMGVVTGVSPGPVPREALEAWLAEYRPEVLVSASAFVRPPLEELGWSIPRDIGFVDLCLEETPGGAAGVRENCERVGELATEMLIAHLQQNNCGVPAVGTATVVEGLWVDGASLPSVRPAAPIRLSRREPFEAQVLTRVA